MDESAAGGNRSDANSSMEQNWPILAKSPMPAWVPAVSVAIAMFTFLAASFYIRHRKVVKKRQILMDYFYIIFQYGGLRRKRMVTSLCNTNAITLRQLGRSFMLSFDSRDNSCPFFLDDTAFSKTNNYTPTSYFKNEPKSKNRLRAPFKRVMSQIDDSNIGNSVHEMFMKFKSRKKTGNTTPPSRHGLAPPRRSSLSSIHEDESALERYDLETTPLRYGPRQSTYERGGYKKHATSIAELFGDSDEGPYPNILIEEINRSRRSSFRRKSYPNNSSDADDEELHMANPALHNLRVVQLGTSASRRRRSSVINPEGIQARKCGNNEPLILVHSASNDISSSQESDEIQAQCSNGIVFLRRVSRDCSRVDNNVYSQERSGTSYSQHKRASLSTVSYVPSGNMNDYYNYNMHSSKQSPESNEDDDFETEEDLQTNKSRGRFSRKKSPYKAYSPQTACHTNRGKRLSLGEIGISNFNQRVEESLGSMQEQESEGSFSRLSKELSDDKRKSHGAWKRLKNVFAGIRWSQSSGPKPKQVKSSASEDRNKFKSKRVNNNGKWNRFFSALTGFRSLPEEKKFSSNPEVHLGSKSLPMGLDKHSVTIDDLELHFATSTDSQAARHKRRNTKTSTSRGDTMEEKPHRRAPPKTRSFPDNIFFFQGDTRKVPCLFQLQSDPATYHKCTTRKSKKRNDTWDDSKRCRSNVDFLHSPLHTGYLPFSLDPNNGCCYHRSGSVSPRATSPVTRKQDRRYRSLSPLPERQHFSSGPRKEKNVRWYSHSARNSFSERGLSMSLFESNKRTNSFIFPSEVLPKGSSQNNITLGTGCVLKSYENLGRSSLLSVRHPNQAARDGSVSCSLDYITIDMEPRSPGDQITIGLDEANKQDDKCVEKIKEECVSIESDSFGKDVEHSSSRSQSPSSPLIHDKTNSSMDSMYFDAFSIPGSPQHSIRKASVPKQSPHLSHVSLCGDDSPSTSISINTLPSDENSLSSLAYQQVPLCVETSLTSSCDNNVDRVDSTFSLISSEASAFQKYTKSCVQQCVAPTASSPFDQNISATCEVLPDQSKYSTSKSDIENNQCCSVSLLNETSEISADISIPHFGETTSSLSSDEKGACTEVNTPLLSGLEKTNLKHQHSLTSDEESYMANLARLPRFGRRASQCSSPPVTNLKAALDERKRFDNPASCRKSPTSQTKSPGTPSPSTTRFVFDV